MQYQGWLKSNRFSIHCVCVIRNALVYTALFDEIMLFIYVTVINLSYQNLQMEMVSCFKDTYVKLCDESDASCCTFQLS